MKRSNNVLNLLIAFALNMCSVSGNVYSQVDSSDYYFYGSDSIFMYGRTDYVFVEFQPTVNEAKQDSCVSQYGFVNDTLIRLNTSRTLLAVDATLSWSDLNDSIAAMCTDSSIKVVNPLYTDSSNLGQIYFNNELVLLVDSIVEKPYLDSILQTYHCSSSTVDTFDSRVFYTESDTTLSAFHLSRILRELSFISFCEPILSSTVQLTTNDPLYHKQWGFKNDLSNGTGGGGCSNFDIFPEPYNTSAVGSGDLGLDIVYDLARGSAIKLAVFDVGVDMDHEDIASNIAGGYDATGIDNDGDVTSIDEITFAGQHGTACAGIVAAIGDNNKGIVGVAPEVSLFSYDIFHVFIDPITNFERLDSDPRQIANAFNHAWIVNDCDVFSNSWAGGAPSNLITRALSNAKELGRNGKGVVIINSSGNRGIDVEYPANLESTISVGGLSACLLRMNSTCADAGYGYGSSFGNNLDVMAPGVAVPTLSIPGFSVTCGTSTGYDFNFGGTSAAGPHVAGIAALVLSLDETLTSDEVQDLIEQSCQKVRSSTYNYASTSGRPNGTWHAEMGYGLPNATVVIHDILSQRVSYELLSCTQVKFFVKDYSAPGNPDITWTYNGSSVQGETATFNIAGMSSQSVTFQVGTESSTRAFNFKPPILELNSGATLVTTVPDNLVSLTYTGAFSSFTAYTWMRNGIPLDAVPCNCPSISVSRPGIYSVKGSATCGENLSDIIQVKFSCETSNYEYHGSAVEITTNTIWTDPTPSAPENAHYLDGDIVIKPGGSLSVVNTNLIMGSCAKIVIEDGTSSSNAYMELNNSTISACDYWKGIIIEGTGTSRTTPYSCGELKIEDGYITDAGIAVQSENGGVFTISTSTSATDLTEFGNNALHIICKDYLADVTNSLVEDVKFGHVMTEDEFISECTYSEIGDDLPFDQVYANCQPYIGLQDIENIQIQGNFFFNNKHWEENQSLGVFADNVDDFWYEANSMNSSRKGFLRGVHIENSVDANISNNVLNNLDADPVIVESTGIYCKELGGSTISNNSISQFTTGFGYYEQSNFSSQITSFSENYIADGTYGVSVAPEQHSMVQPDNSANGSSSNIEVEIECNDFTDLSIGILSFGDLREQLSGNQDPGNSFSNTAAFDLYIYNPHNLTNKLYNQKIGASYSEPIGTYPINASSVTFNSRIYLNASTDACSPSPFLGFNYDNNHLKLDYSPIPTSGLLLIKSEFKLIGIECLNMSGQRVLFFSTPQGSIDLSKLPSGIYIIEATTFSNLKFRQKVIKS